MFNKKKHKSPILDGYVDIKIFNENNELVYHDSGDNTVTQWMRQVLLELLSGFNYQKEDYDEDEFNKRSFSFTDQSSTRVNPYLLNRKVDEGEGYFHNFTNEAEARDNFFSNSDGNKTEFKMFPTKILFGTGVEFSSFDDIKDRTSSYPSYFANVINMYGFGDQETAKTQINNLIKWDKEDSFKNGYSATDKTGSNTYSSAATELENTITLNDFEGETETKVVSPSEYYLRYGVVGGIKTILKKNGDTTYLNPVESESGKLLRTQYRGVGEPCFIYLQRDSGADSSTTVSDFLGSGKGHISIEKESGEDIYTIFRISMNIPSNNSGEYNPYNGYTIKEVGLYNDTLLKGYSSVMPYGTLLAVKGLTPFTKSYGSNIQLTWELTI